METHTPSTIFTFLQDQVPVWLEGLALIELHCQQHGQAYNGNSTSSHATAESPHTEIVHLENGELRKVVVSSSASPIQTGRSSAVKDFRRAPASPPDSINASGARKNSYRARNAIVVSYDSTVQKRLEAIADGVTKVKDMIRRAKSSRSNRSRCFIRQALKNIEDEDNNDDDDDEDELDDDTVLAQVRMRRERMSGTRQSNAEETKSNEALDATDTRLTRVQDLCATAAFQLLRDGDCSEETHGAVGELNEVLKTARESVAASRAEEIVATFSNPVDVSKAPWITYHARTSIESSEMPLPVRLTQRLNATSKR